MPRNSADFGICQHTVTRKMPPRPLVYLNARVTVALSFVSQRSEDSVVAAVEAEHQLSNKKVNLQLKKKRPAIQTYLATVFFKAKKGLRATPHDKSLRATSPCVFSWRIAAFVCVSGHLFYGPFCVGVPKGRESEKAAEKGRKGNSSTLKSESTRSDTMSVSSNASSASNKDSVDSPSSTTNTDSSELTHILNRRQEIMESQEAGIEVRRTYKVVNVYTDFPEFSRNQIKDYQKTFNT